MENKLQQLTEKLYNEGLSKGRAEAEAVLAKAHADAEKIVAEAQDKAREITAQAEKAAAQLKTNTENEVRLAAGQLKSALRQQVETMVQMEVVTPAVSQAWRDNSFIQQLAVEAVQTLDPKQGLRVVLPENRGNELVEAVKNALAERFGADNGIEVVTDARVRVPFRVMVKEGGYYVSFADADFDALFRSYLRPKVAQLLFGDEK
ncbi:MAG TPA: hypothetical protein H9888_04410 [Candidatus Rikenella faecigallinarum]|uniref:V-type ATP synthase subunit E n=1 Tax=Candidatus Rikenella faecigallinarum TaxID=2838745 RepID=A0A9D1TYX7_9BACT|nr:hypothetical protein [Candidatus Rikenella faecigallinarum]